MLWIRSLCFYRHVLHKLQARCYLPVCIITLNKPFESVSPTRPISFPLSRKIMLCAHFNNIMHKNRGRNVISSFYTKVFLYFTRLCITWGHDRWRVVVVRGLVVTSLSRNPVRTTLLCHRPCVFYTYATCLKRNVKIWKTKSHFFSGGWWDYSG